MSAQKRAPSFDRLDPSGNSIVQILVDIRCGDRVDGGNAHFPLCGRKRLVDDDVDVIKPSELCNVLMAQRATAKAQTNVYFRIMLMRPPFAPAH
jgi:hypothetical protein